MNTAGCLLIYGGGLLLCVGVASLLRPMRFLRVTSRRKALGLVLAGLLSASLGASLPAPARRASSMQSHLDRWVPEWQFGEYHALDIDASPDRVYRAIREVTADDIFLFRTLTWIRNPARRVEGASILAPSERPIVDVALEGGFFMLDDDPPHELVMGTLVLWDGLSRPTGGDGLLDLLRRPGNALAAINFRVVEQREGSCRLITETRTYASDDDARRKFARYWRVIYPGSSLLRHTWLRAIRRHAEEP